MKTCSNCAEGTNLPDGYKVCPFCGLPLAVTPTPVIPIQVEEPARPQGWGVFYQWGEGWTSPFGWQKTVEDALTFLSTACPWPSDIPHFVGFVSLTADHKVHVIQWFKMVWDASAKKWTQGEEVKDLPEDFSMSALERGGISG